MGDFGYIYGYMLIASFLIGGITGIVAGQMAGRKSNDGKMDSGRNTILETESENERQGSSGEARKD